MPAAQDGVRGCWSKAGGAQPGSGRLPNGYAAGAGRSGDEPASYGPGPCCPSGGGCGEASGRGSSCASARPGRAHGSGRSDRCPAPPRAGAGAGSRPANQSRAGRPHSIAAAKATIIAIAPPENGDVSISRPAATLKPIRAAWLRWKV